MRPTALFFLMGVSLRQRWRRYLGVALGLAVGMLALGLSVVGAAGFGISLHRHLDEIVPRHRVTLRPQAMDLMWLKVETAPITAQKIEAVRQVPGVLRVSPELALQFPASARGQILGNELVTDLTVTGVEDWVLGEDLPPNFQFDPAAPDATIPCLVSQYFLELYNTAYAQSAGLPKLSRKALVGRDFDLVLGASLIQSGFGGAQQPRTQSRRCEVVGLSRNPELLGLQIPIEAVRHFNRQFGHPESKPLALHVELRSADSIDRLREAIAPLGLTVQDRAAMLRRVLSLAKLLGAAFALFGGLVFLLSLAYMLSSIQAMMQRRRREMATCGAVGASPRQLLIWVVGELSLVCLLGVVSGLCAAIGLIALANHQYALWRQAHLTFPERLFAMPWQWILLLGLLCWIIGVGLGALRLGLRRGRSLNEVLSQADY